MIPYYTHISSQPRSNPSNPNPNRSSVRSSANRWSDFSWSNACCHCFLRPSLRAPLSWEKHHLVNWEIYNLYNYTSEFWGLILNFGQAFTHPSWFIMIYKYLSGWWYTYPSEKYESVGMMKFPTEWKKMFQTTNQYTTYNWGGLTLYRSIDGLEIQKWWFNQPNWF